MPTIYSRPLNLVFAIPISKTLKFWEGLKEGKIYTTKCKECGKLYFPPVADCAECVSSNVEWIELTGKGEIETFTHIMVKPTSFQRNRPYTVAIAKLEEGVRVLAWLTGAKFSEIKVGMKVKLQGKDTPDGATYEFVPIKSEK